MDIKKAQLRPLSPKRRCVLIVDDEPCSGELLRAVLRQEDVVHTAFSAEEGIAKASEVMPELVLLGLKMCRGDPLQVLRRLKQIHGKTNVVVLSDLAGTDAANQAFQAGAADFIPKPIDPQRLRECVQKFLAGPASPEAGSQLNGCLVGRSPSILTQLLERAEVGIAPLWNNNTAALVDKGMPIRFVKPDPGPVAVISFFSEITGTRHPELVQEWLNDILSVEYQTLAADRPYYFGPSVRGVPVPEAAKPYTPATPEEVLRLQTIDWTKIAPVRGQIVDRFDRELAS